MIKAVLFDLDGTLLNTNDLIIKSFTNTRTNSDEILSTKHFGNG